MKRYVEYGVFGSAIMVLLFILIAFISSVVINLSVIAICLGGGIISGLFIGIALHHFSPGEIIPEGEEDKYIN
ncbi:MAG: hypothetical protein JXR64_08890 [Spirochaetales bacterium]|nr:hypothetical protein [Spirochaetales bacterium]